MRSSAAIRFLLLVVLASATTLTLESATAGQRNDLPGPTSPSKDAQVRGELKVVTMVDMADASSYLQNVYRGVKKSWYAHMPASVKEGQQGKNSVEFQIMEDGSIPKDSVKLVSSSGKDDFDSASVRAIREAGPFGRLPEKSSQHPLTLRFSFSYNMPTKTQ